MKDRLDRPSARVIKGIGENASMGKLAGKVALITGASRGIGKAVALAYASESAKFLRWPGY